NAAGGNVRPGCVGHQTNPRDRLRQQRVAPEGFFPRQFTSIHIWFAHEAGGVDHKFRLHLSNVVEELLETGVINGGPRERNETGTAAAKFAGESLTDITGCP